ncbi:MAG TPA: hypothetical protein VFR31_09150 [Thermoanaerobaculia bacterium]|nr:hypothetical protein [Thermoanaerobaculia bacterium]
MRGEVLQALGRLRSGTDAARRDLEAALRDAVSALDQGQIPGSLLSPDVPPIQAGSAPPSLVSLRSSPLSFLDPLAPAWTRGMRPSATRGPFFNEFGERFWIDTFLLPRLVTFKSGSALLGLFPVLGGLTPARQMRLGEGSVWLAVRLLVPGRPLNELIGLRISGGTARFEGTVTEEDSAVTLGGAWKLTLRLEVADRTSDSVELPETLALELGPAGLGSLTYGDARANAHGTTVGISRSAEPPFHDGFTRSVVLPGTASPGELSFSDVRSEVWGAEGTAPVERAGWAFPVSIAAGEAQGSGSVWLELGRGASVRWEGVELVDSEKSVVSAAPGSLTTTATIQPDAVTQTLGIWDGSSVELFSAAGSTVIHVSQPGLDAALFSGRAVGHLDRPLAADGKRIAVKMPSAWLGLLSRPEGIEATLLGSDPLAAQKPHLAIALENALLKVRPPMALFASGPFTGDRIFNGRLWLRFALRLLLPTLPDPYAASFETQSRTDVDAGWVTARVNWNASMATLAFQVETGAELSQEPRFDEARIESERISRGLVLLDVSSRADQLGVQIPAEGMGRVRLDGLSMVAQARDVRVLTLPPISWEPMLTKAPEEMPGVPWNDKDIPLPPPPHDGGPAIVVADAVELRPVEPVELLRAYHDAIEEKRRFSMRLPLPFGLIAHVERKEPAREPDCNVSMNRPRFGGNLRGGQQLSLRGIPITNPGSRNPALPGWVELEGDYARGVLSTNIYTRFKGDFGEGATGVPVRRYDLSGYGASLLSDWRDPAAAGPAIIQARFDVFVGRTAHEVIQMQSILYPYHARVVRTITIERARGGWVLREDSGWVAASDGLFDYTGVPAAFTPAQIHPGAIVGLVKIRNIRLSAGQFPLGKSIWQPVRFDADVEFRAGSAPPLEVAGGSSANRTPGRGISGWILIDGEKYPGGKLVRPANGAEICDLLTVKGPASVPITCTLQLGGIPGKPGLAFNATRVDVSCAGPGTDLQLVAAVLGSPLLPRDGAWSVGRMKTGTDTAPKALDPSFPLPLVLPTPPATGSNRWHFSDPADILLLADNAAPATVYGFLQSLGTQKVFFERPRVEGGAKPIQLPRPPRLADMGALLSAAGIFPGLAQAFDIPGLTGLDAGGGEIKFSREFQAVKPDEVVMADLGGSSGIKLKLRYRHENENPTTIKLTVDPGASPRWSVSLDRVAFVVTYQNKPLIRIFAAVGASETSAPVVKDVRVRYDDFLDSLNTVFTNIQQLAKYLPGGKDAGLRVAFSQGRLTVRNGFALPNLPLGAGQITDVALEMGFDVTLAPFDVTFVAGIGRSNKPFRWVVSPLAGTGVVQVGINRGGLDVLVQGGIGVGLCIDVGIATGSASITLAVEIITGGEKFQIKGILSGRASVEVLMGLASATITLAAGLGIIAPLNLSLPPVTDPIPTSIGPFEVGLLASVSVGIHITICWVIDIDFEAEWQFRQDIDIPAIGIPS